MPTHRSRSPVLLSLWAFCVDILVGTLIFLLIALSAAGLDRIVYWLDGKVGEWLVRSLGFAEHVLFYMDVGLYMVFLLFSTIHATIELWNNFFGDDRDNENGSDYNE